MKGFLLKFSVLGPIMAIIGFFLIVILLFGLWEVHQEKRALQKTLDMVENSIERERQEIEVKVDSLQEIIEEQKSQNNFLKEEIEVLEKKKVSLNSEADEKEITILRTRDVDSLRREISRYYRR